MRSHKNAGSVMRKVTQVPASLLTVDQVADRLRVSRWTVYNLIRSRQLASLTVGRCRRITEAALNEFISLRTEQEVA
ncbi:helix-turn-helix domain-containing protein [Streptomyces sp. NPDC050610]|uniref:helix-turn-helix domain-containing protein n=1 Tax=Streptomyces sp. NPDC050610 TaxID=3157097 RepID=UPI0034434A36